MGVMVAAAAAVFGLINPFMSAVPLNRHAKYTDTHTHTQCSAVQWIGCAFTECYFETQNEMRGNTIQKTQAFFKSSASL